MYKRGLGVFSLLVVLILTLSFVSAQETNETDLDVQDEGTDIETGEDDEDFEEETDEDGLEDDLDTPDEDIDIENLNAELRNPGITPDSTLYFVEDAILTRFRGDLDNVEKKAAEIKAMIQAGKIEEARVALARFNQYADRIEKEVSPENQEEAKRIAAAIRNAINEIESEIPDSDREEFIDNVLDKSKRIETAAEIATKIKELCETLAKLDPDQYSRTCKTGDDAPRWQKRLDKDLTEEQRKEARAFFEIMSQCMETSGRECRCQDISVKAFADKCSVVAPLATQCDEGDENACQQMEDESDGIEDLLPEYLQEIMVELEGRFNNAQFENFAPPECREANAKTPKECMQIMVRTHAPEECIAALDADQIKFESERQFRKDCEKLMFEANAPQECIDAGITDGRECGRFMFKQNAPQECIDAGITGDSPSDGRKCRDIMEKLGGPGGRGGPGPNMDCRRIENAEERLKCYDEAISHAGEFRGDENRGPPGGWPEPCEKAQAFTRESCEKIMRESGEQQFREDRQRFEERRFEEGPRPMVEPFGPQEPQFREEMREQFEQAPRPEEGQMMQQFEQSQQQIQEPSPSTAQQDSSSSSATAEGGSSSEPSPTTDSAVSGNVILNPDSSNNPFVKYFFEE